MADSQFDPNQETLEAPSPIPTRTSSGDQLREAARKLVNVVEGSTPHLSSETRDVLQIRLLAASAMFSAGFAAFLLRWLFSGEPLSSPWLLWLHCGITLVMACTALILKASKTLTLTKLRLIELTLFVGLGVYFVVVSQQKLQHMANLENGAHLPIILTPWLILIFTYALFIPNNWQRAAAVLVPMGLAPIGVMLMQRIYCTGFQECLHSSDYKNYISDQSIGLVLAVSTAVVGVHLINRLRRQVFAAKQLGQYRLKQKLGSGGMGEVYLAEHQMMKRPCAIKLIKPDKAGDSRILARFEREVRSTAKLSHWNSIDIFDYGNTADGTFYYVMEYLPGHNIGELVEQGGPLPPARMTYLMRQVCAALAEAHGVGLVHRDIKPANIFCAYRGGEFDVAKLLDFGLAKPMLQSEDGQLTQEGSITGSPLFMPPEQATGEREADARSDIYSLGAVMFYMLTGRAPFSYEQPMKVIIAHVSEDPPLLREFAPDATLELEEIVMRCLEKDPDHRYQSVIELRDALADLQLDDVWTPDLAADWWNCKACPQRKALAAAAVEAAAV
ncbi:serine/threonine protein kinase [Aeoliella mucimassa]|uniref:non-specific serine/threonine protein kinase n=1 Tax=Aeoliella mucimassa TaxID=2527972 RepID=A0A518AM59_9BACT|nr:serine/threonine-protein kinase [Aeoliella mucimassa]QDU55809.1 Serine/threonine-protein kinase PknB [Aeoliella mucimassa]